MFCIMKYSFWVGRLQDGEIELWMEFFEPSQAIAWRKKHFRGEKDVVCVEHKESGKLSSSIRKTINYCPEWADGTNWRVVTDETVKHIEIIKLARKKKTEKMLETKRLRELEEKKRAMELALEKEDAYGMSEKEHKDLTDNLIGDTK